MFIRGLCKIGTKLVTPFFAIKKVRSSDMGTKMNFWVFKMWYKNKGEKRNLWLWFENKNLQKSGVQKV